MDRIFKNSSELKEYIQNNIQSEHPIIKAMNTGKLIIFIGSGMSVHLGMPSWSGFASKYIDYIYEESKNIDIDYKTKENLKKETTKKLLSICRFIATHKTDGEINIDTSKINEKYKEWFKIKENDKKKELDDKLYMYKKLYDLNAIYLTTNYDNALDLCAKMSRESDIKVGIEGKTHIDRESKKYVFFKENEFEENILQPGNVIHIHGSIEDIDTMVISNEDYINKYGYSNMNQEEGSSQKIYSEFMECIFKEEYTVLFLGYGLEEIEILQYMFDNKPSNRYQDRYMLLSCYASDYTEINIKTKYYKSNYGVDIIPYDITDKGHNYEIGRILYHLKDLHTEFRAVENLSKFKQTLELIGGI